MQGWAEYRTGIPTYKELELVSQPSLTDRDKEDS